MKILHHDFAGYPYPLDLSRQLACGGHEVAHVYCESLTTTPGGKCQRQHDDPSSLEIVPLVLDQPLAKYAFLQRRRQEIQFGKMMVREIDNRAPDVVISAKRAPLDTQRLILRACRRRNVRFIFWAQDLLGIAARRILAQKLPLVGWLVGNYYLRMEARLLRSSDAVVPLTADFTPILTDWGVRPERITVIENWAPVEDIPTGQKQNPWSVEHGLDGKFCFIYAGSMGLKHNPELIAALAREFAEQSDVRIVVLSHGHGADWLAEQKAQHGLDNLMLKGFVHFSKMPHVMAAADVLVAVLEEDAGVFSVPSKVLAYLCSQRPILAAMPAENLASRILTSNQAGLVAQPSDTSRFVEMARRLYEDADLRCQLATNGRRYAEHDFPIQEKARAFQEVIDCVMNTE